MSRSWSRRAAEPRDVEDVYALYAGAAKELLEWDDPREREAFCSTFDPGAWVLVEAPAGLAAILRVERKRLEILVHALVVAPAERSKGLATAALRELIDESVRSDVPVAIHVPPRATPALRLLKFLGFVVVPSSVAGRSRLVWRA